VFDGEQEQACKVSDTGLFQDVRPDTDEKLPGGSRSQDPSGKIADQ